MFSQFFFLFLGKICAGWLKVFSEVVGLKHVIDKKKKASCPLLLDHVYWKSNC